MSIRELIASKEDAYFGNGVPEEQIRAAEEKLSLSFAADYREYLSTVGLAMFDGHELTGIGKAERTDVVSVTMQMKALQDDIPADWYVVENENMDGAAIWQDSKGRIFFNKKLEFCSLSEFIADL